MSSRNARETLAPTREARTAISFPCCVRAPRSGGRAPSLRLRLHVPNLPPSPCSIGRLGTGRTAVEVRTHAVKWGKGSGRERWGWGNE